MCALPPPPPVPTDPEPLRNLKRTSPEPLLSSSCRHQHGTKPSFTNRLCDCCACREQDPASSSPREEASLEDAASSDTVAGQRSSKFPCAAGHRKSFSFLRASFHGNTRHSWNHDVFEFCSSCGDHLEIHSQRVQPPHAASQQSFNVCLEALSLLVRVCIITSTYLIRIRNVSSFGTNNVDRCTS